MAETAEYPTCSCGHMTDMGNGWRERWLDVTPGPVGWRYCPHCGDLLGDGTTTPPATAEQLRDAEAMAALRKHNLGVVRPLKYPMRNPWADREPEHQWWEVVRVHEDTHTGLYEHHEIECDEDPAAAILLAAERLQADKEGDADAGH